MVLRYHWGEGIGHAYTYSNDYHGANYIVRRPESVRLVGTDSCNSGGIGIEKAGFVGNGEDSGDELTLKDREELDWDEINITGDIASEEGMESDNLGSDPDWVDD